MGDLDFVDSESGGRYGLLLGISGNDLANVLFSSHATGNRSFGDSMVSRLSFGKTLDCPSYWTGLSPGGPSDAIRVWKLNELVSRCDVQISTGLMFRNIALFWMAVMRFRVSPLRGVWHLKCDTAWRA